MLMLLLEQLSEKQGMRPWNSGAGFLMRGPRDGWQQRESP